MVHDSDEHSGNTISGGIFFSAVIQGRDITVVLPPQITPAMAGLPAASAAFTGRDSDLDTLLQALAPSHSEGSAAGARPVVVTAVGGMGGVGKTELALQAAHTALGRGWFPGGVLFADMFGYDPDRRRTAAQAAAGLVRALGVPGEHVPADAQDLERLLRSVLDYYATQGRPVLVVIDNVSDQDQAVPLLPAHPACRTIVTSRNTLGRLGARLLDLDTLGVGQAVELLRLAVEVARPGDQRVSDHPGDARRVAELCGGLPLALQIAAAQLADNPGKPLAALVSDLHDQANRLAELSYGGDTLTRVFDLSYRQLDSLKARIFRLLSANPGPDISTPAAAALTDLDEAGIRRGLEALARAHLIEPGSGYGRWRMHDLIRLYSAHRGMIDGSTDNRDQAFRQLLSYYLFNTMAANAHIGAPVAHASSLGFATPEQALSWLDAEYPNLVATAYAAEADHNYRSFARDLPNVMQDFLLWRRHLNDWVDLSRIGVVAARALGDDYGLAASLLHFGNALNHLRRFEEAAIAYQEATQIYQKHGRRAGEAMALGNLGTALCELERIEEAIAADRQSLQICLELRDRRGASMALANLGLALRNAQRFDEAVTVQQDAVRIFRELSDQQGEANALDNLGSSLEELRRFEEAIAAHQTAARIFRELGDQHGAGIATHNLGTSLAKAKRLDQALTTYEDAARIFRQLSDRRNEASTLLNLERALLQSRRFAEAYDAGTTADRILRELGEPRQEFS